MEDPEDVLVTNSEVESVMNQQRRKETLCQAVFTDQEFNAFNSVDTYLKAAQTGLEGIANLLLTDMKVRNGFQQLNVNTNPVSPEL